MKIRNKIIGMILCVLLCGSMFAGCALVEHNDKKDAQQVVAVIDPIEEAGSAKKVIYKSELISTMNSYAQSYMQNYGLTLKETTERLLDEMVTRELLLIEAQRLLNEGLIEWTQKDSNDKMRSVYSSIDSRIESLRQEILTERDEGSTSSDDTNNNSTSTTYPTPPAEEQEDDEQEEETEVWAPAPQDYPCLYGTESQKSLDREAVRRFVSLLRDIVDGDVRATAEDKAKFKEDDKTIDTAVRTKGWEGVYPILGNTHYLEYIVGTSAEQSILITKLQDYITDSVQVTQQEVTDAYNSQLAYQKAAYRNDASAYQTAVSGGSTTMLYYLDTSYFFVKHILLPFSDEQTAALTAYKAQPNVSKNDIKEYRDRLVNDIVVYPHKDGENDESNPMTVQGVMDEIYGAMYALEREPKQAERKFDEFTYKYNTDPGAFGQGKSYAVKRGDDTGHSGYMEEFYDGAMELATDYAEGQMLPHYVVTDYGVHLMYFSQNIKGDTERGLYEDLTPAGYSTVYKTLESTIKTAKENNAFTAWQNERITYYRENAGVVHTYPKRYKSLY